MVSLFDILLITATLLCSLVAGFLFAFAVIAMPGLGRLRDGAFLRAFQEVDGVIQRNQPVFMLVWVGSVVSLLAAAGVGAFRLDGLERLMLVAAAALYIGGVQVPTVSANIPLNNHVQTLNVDALSADEQRTERGRFEARWNRWNGIRTVVSIGVSVLLMVTLLLR